jgi:hypothetical protein
MFLLAHRFLRRTVLGLMFFLAGTAYCSCDSYDPDPYDDIPPVVTVQFNYLVPVRVNIARPHVQTGNQLDLLSMNSVWHLPSADMVGLREPQVDFAFYQGPSQLAIPLRC